MADPNKVLAQFQKPSGWIGRLNVWDMNRRHSRLTDWGLKHVSIDDHDTILDVGCGGGRTVYKLAALAASGKVFGIDYSEASVTVSRKTNRDWVRRGRVEIQHASVSHLPFPQARFDLVTAVETHYYWPDLAADMGEILRVLKPLGTLLLIAEAYKGGKYEKRFQRFEELLKQTNRGLLTAEEHREMFAKAGFIDIQVDEDYEKGWISAKGRKPALGS
jgi:SAM-dependent methyltransferase